MAKPDLIHVSAHLLKEVPANAAYVYLTVQGSSAIRGSEALSKAKEVSQLAEALAKIGLPADAVQLRGVRATRESGAILTSSSAIYSIRIHCKDLETLPAILGVVTTQKHVTVGMIDWKYPFDEDDSIRNEWVDQCVARADEKARRIARTLGVQVLGVHRVSEADPAGGFREREMAELGMFGAMDSVKLGFRDSSKVDLGLEMMHTKQVFIKVNAEYRVSALAEIH